MSWRTIAATPRAEGESNRQLLPTSRRSGQQQVRDVGAGDQQHEADHGQQHREERYERHHAQVAQARQPATGTMSVLVTQEAFGLHSGG
jgi:hypothetical protein